MGRWTLGKVGWGSRCCTTVTWELVIPLVATTIPPGNAIRWLDFDAVNCLGLSVVDDDPMVLTGFTAGEYSVTLTNDPGSSVDITSFLGADTSDTWGFGGTTAPGDSQTATPTLDGTDVAFAAQSSTGAYVSGTVRFCRV